MSIINQHPVGSHPFSISLSSTEEDTSSGVAHRELLENGHNDVLLGCMLPALEKHHISSESLERHKDLIDSLRIANAPIIRSPYPQNFTTQKGNFAEIFLAEYLSETSETELPIYRLRYNPNPDQSMKGDDVLLFDLDSNPVRIIVGESKFRSTPDKQSVIDIVDGLIRSNKEGLPISLMFVAERLFQEGKAELGKKVQNCAVLFTTNKLRIDYVGFLMSNQNAKNTVNKHTSNNLKSLLMISLGMQKPAEIIQQAFKRLEEDI
ncbi:MAG: Hachiman antiphage defense system protein HamA [Anaerovorax sp.]|nr:Hachiman antiphage defense system protein HamA [Anaerovorax sp.]